MARCAQIGPLQRKLIDLLPAADHELSKLIGRRIADIHESMDKLVRRGIVAKRTYIGETHGERIAYELTDAGSEL